MALASEKIIEKKCLYEEIFLELNRFNKSHEHKKLFWKLNFRSIVLKIVLFNMAYVLYEF